MVVQLQDFETSDLPEATKAALRFMDGWLLHHAQAIDDQALETLKRHFTPRQIVELTALAGIYESVHKFNHLFELPASSGIVGFENMAPPDALAERFSQLLTMRSNH